MSRSSAFRFFFFFKQKTAYEIHRWLEFRRVLFRSHGDSAAHRARSDDRGSAHRKRLHIGGHAGNLAGLAFREEHVHERLALRAIAALIEVFARSEERRVGKEGRIGGLAQAYKTKRN